MVDITQANDEEIGATVDAFAAAAHAKAVTLEDVSLGRILLAVDASNQGETAERFAAALAARHKARVLLVYAYEGVRDDARERYVGARAEALTRAGVMLDPIDEPVRTEHGRRAFEQILDAIRERGCDLAVVPAPYLDDYRRLGEESVGATLDVLVARSPAPLLVVREPDARPQASLARTLLPVSPCTAVTIAAASWMLALVRDDATVELLASRREDAGATVAQPVSAATAETAGLVAAVQRRCADAGLRCNVLDRAGDPLDVTVEAANSADGLLVLPVAAERSARAFALAAVRCSRNPVLVVTSQS